MMLNFRFYLLLPVLLIWIPVPGFALSVARIFSDHMVLQRQQNVPVWGQGEPGQVVIVEFAGQSRKTLINELGRWKVELDSLVTNTDGIDLFVRSNQKQIVVRDVLVGEVWFAGGQSNMAYAVKSMAGKLQQGRELVDQANLNQIRFRKINAKDSPAPVDDLNGGSWVVCSPRNVSSFSAVAYVFARRIHRELGIPVGVIECAWGGTPIEPYIPRSAFVGHQTLVKIVELTDNNDHEGIRNLRGGTYIRNNAWLPGRIYNGRIAPVAPYAIRGAIWYQGESNCGKGEDPRDYAHKMRALVRGWRESWKREDLPVYYVQLPQWNSYAWTYLREEQALAMDMPNTGMVVTLDLDYDNDIHPPNKIDVGERLARWPLAKQYGRAILTSSPRFNGLIVKGKNIEVKFDDHGAGLMIGRSVVGRVIEEKDELLYGFEIANSDGNWYEAKARIQGNTVILSATEIKDPIAARYACRPVVPDGKCWNLYGRHGLPASPFCSNWELMPYDASKNPR